MRARVGWTVAAISAFCLVVDTAVLARFQPLLAEETVAVHGWPLVNAAALGSTVMGAVIVSRYPRHPIGWLLSLVGGITSLSLLLESYSLWVDAGGGPGPVWAGHAAGWLAAALGGPTALSLIALLFLLVPDGRFLSRRWRMVAVGLAVGLLSFITGLLSVPPSEITARADPAPVGRFATISISVGALVVTTMLLASVVCMIVRLRRAQGEERLQLLWIVTAATCVGVGLVFLLMGQALNAGRQTWVTSLPLFVSYLLLPAAIAVAVLHHRLYDIDLIINRAVILTAGTLLVAGTYIVVVVGVGGAVGQRTAGFWPSLLTTAVVAVAFQPVRSRVVRLADRLAYGPRAGPYDTLSAFSRQVGQSQPLEALLPAVAEATGRAVAATCATARLELAPGPAVEATWRPSEQPRESKPAGPTAKDVSFGVDVIDQTGRLGSIAVCVPAGRDVRPHERRLIEGIADQAALAFRNARLEAELAARVDALDRQTVQLAASRRRLFEAADAERQRLATAITRQVLPPLHQMTPTLERLQADVLRSDVHDRVAELVDEATVALESLRELTHGVFPTVLARSGLGPALAAQRVATSGGNRVHIAPEAHRRFPERVEAAAYFCCLLALQSDPSGKASVDVAVHGGELLLEMHGTTLVEQDRQAMIDRVEAAGGSTDLSVTAGQHAVHVWIPILAPGQPEVAAAHS